MTQITPEQQLSAIMFTDIVGYTALMGQDKEKALSLVRTSVGFQKSIVEKHRGTWLKEMGDGAMAQFRSAIDAVHCALEIQKTSRQDFEGELRIGIHLGDITIENNDVYGDGVNVAARLESITDPGGIFISDAVQKAIRGNFDIQAKYLGELELKNVDYGVRTYALQGPGLPVPKLEHEGLKGHFFAEVERRGVFRAGLAYVAIGLIISLAWNQLAKLGVPLPAIPVEAIIIILAAGFPVAMYLAWSFERGPDGFIRTSSKQSWRNPLNASQRKPLTSNGMLILLLFMVVALLLIPKSSVNEEQQEGSISLEFYLGDNSIAVLPFENLSSDPEQEYFSDGITDDVLNYLAKISGLRVKSRTSTLQYKKTEKTIGEIGAELGVGNILQGTIRKSGNRVRIVAQLINVKTDEYIWSEAYEKDLTEIFAIQSEVAQKIADALEVTISSAEIDALNKKTPDLVAYDYLLKARDEMNRGYVESFFLTSYQYGYSPDALQNAELLLNKAIEYDSTIAEAYLELARLYASGTILNVDNGLKTVNQAIALDPSLADAFLIRSQLFANIGRNDEALEDLNQAALLQPNNPNVLLIQSIEYMKSGNYKQAADMAIKSAQFAYGYSDPNYLVRWSYVFLYAGDIQKAIELLEEARRLDPTSLNALFALVVCQMKTNNHTERLKYSYEIVQLVPDFTLVADGIAWSYYSMGDLDNAEKYWSSIYHTGQSAIRLGIVKMENGKFEEGEKIFFEKMHSDSVRASAETDLDVTGAYYDLAVGNAYVGNKEEAYVWLEKAVPWLESYGSHWFVNNDPGLNNLRGEPEFERIRTRINDVEIAIREAYRSKLSEMEATEGMKDILR